jgi:hypothetical protein
MAPIDAALPTSFRDRRAQDSSSFISNTPNRFLSKGLKLFEQDFLHKAAYHADADANDHGFGQHVDYFQELGGFQLTSRSHYRMDHEVKKEDKYAKNETCSTKICADSEGPVLYWCP